MDKINSFRVLADSVLADKDGNESVNELYPDIFSRFHISHIGMSSFEDVTLLFIKDDYDKGRFIWKSGNNNIKDAYFEENEIENIFLASLNKWNTYIN